MPSLNPFKGIIETTRSPHARTLRTTFIEKVQDAYWVFAGQSNEYFSISGGRQYFEHRNNHFGFIDYLTLCIPYLFGKLFDLARRNWNTEGFGWKALPIFVGFVYAPFFLLKHTVAALLTIISLPIIGTVHLISQYIAGGAKLKESASILITQAELSKNFPGATINDVIDYEGRFESSGLVLRQYSPSFWRDMERKTCRFQFGLPIPDKSGSPYLFSENIKKLNDKSLPFIKGYQRATIVSELPSNLQSGIVYLLKGNQEGWQEGWVAHSCLNDTTNIKVLTSEQCTKLNNALQKCSQYLENKTTKPIAIERWDPEADVLQLAAQGQKDKMFIADKALVNEIMSICGHTVKNDNDLGTHTLDETEKDMAAYQSLFALNIGCATEMLESSENGQSILDAMFSSTKLGH
jgi:hypothetical protein